MVIRRASTLESSSSEAEEKPSCVLPTVAFWHCLCLSPSTRSDRIGGQGEHQRRIRLRVPSESEFQVALAYSGSVVPLSGLRIRVRPTISDLVGCGKGFAARKKEPSITAIEQTLILD